MTMSNKTYHIAELNAVGRISLASSWLGSLFYIENERIAKKHSKGD